MRRHLIQSAQGATKKKGSFYRAKYNRLRFRLGSANKAKVAVANRIARAVYKVLAGDRYVDIGYMRADPKKDQIKRLMRQLKNLGVDIQLYDHQTIVAINKATVDQTGIVLS